MIERDEMIKYINATDNYFKFSGTMTTQTSIIKLLML